MAAVPSNRMMLFSLLNSRLHLVELRHYLFALTRHDLPSSFLLRVKQINALVPIVVLVKIRVISRWLTLLINVGILPPTTLVPLKVTPLIALFKNRARLRSTPATTSRTGATTPASLKWLFTFILTMVQLIPLVWKQLNVTSEASLKKEGLRALKKE